MKIAGLKGLVSLYILRAAITFNQMNHLVNVCTKEIIEL